MKKATSKWNSLLGCSFFMIDLFTSKCRFDEVAD